MSISEKAVHLGVISVKAGIVILAMPIIFTVGCISFVAVNVLSTTDILHKMMRKKP